ncbi:MAG TPA: hypothetical protein VI365_05460 [Trebonia sp.]
MTAGVARPAAGTAGQETRVGLQPQSTVSPRSATQSRTGDAAGLAAQAGSNVAPGITRSAIAQGASILAGCATVLGCLFLRSETGWDTDLFAWKGISTPIALTAGQVFPLFSWGALSIPIVICAVGIVLAIVALCLRGQSRGLSSVQIGLWVPVVLWSFWALDRLFSSAFAFGDKKSFLWVGLGDLLAVVAVTLLTIDLRQARRPIS